MSNELNYESFNVAFHRAFRHAEDPAAAYEQLRQKLIQFFLSHGHSTEAESLTDEVIDRLLKKLRDDMQIEDDKGVFRFALGVARYVNLEQLRRQRNQSLLSPGVDLGALHQDDSFEAERYSEALESCLKQLRPNERKLLTDYYGARHGETKRLALELGISHGSLRVHVLRLRNRLKEMMDEYLNY